MAITDGQRVRALESNAAWASKTADNTMTGKQTLARPASGATVVDVQQELNDQAADIATAQNDITNLQSDVAALEALDTFIYVGQWDANTNSPLLADGDGGATYGPGATYRVSVAGTQNLGSGSQTFAIGDKLVYNLLGVWEKWDVNDADILFDQLSDVDLTGAVQRSLVNKGATFWEDVNPNEIADSAITGSNQTVAAFDAFQRLVRLTNAGLVSVEGIGFTFDQQKIFITNETGVAVNILNETGATAANRILTGTGATLVLANEATIILVYDGTKDRWKIAGGSGSGGGSLTVPTGNTEGAPQNVTAAGGVSITGGGARTMIFVQGSGGPIEVTANPQIPAGTTVGYELLLVGRSDDNTLTLNDGTGLSLNGQVTLGLNDTILFVWTGSVWLEITRSM